MATVWMRSKLIKMKKERLLMPKQYGEPKVVPVVPAFDASKVKVCEPQDIPRPGDNDGAVVRRATWRGPAYTKGWKGPVRPVIQGAYVTQGAKLIRNGVVVE
jgi:hypothetical protein